MVFNSLLCRRLSAARACARSPWGIAPAGAAKPEILFSKSEKLRFSAPEISEKFRFSALFAPSKIGKIPIFPTKKSSYCYLKDYCFYCIYIYIYSSSINTKNRKNSDSLFYYQQLIHSFSVPLLTRVSSRVVSSARDMLRAAPANAALLIPSQIRAPLSTCKKLLDPINLRASFLLRSLRAQSLLPQIPVDDSGIEPNFDKLTYQNHRLRRFPRCARWISISAILSKSEKHAAAGHAERFGNGKSGQPLAFGIGGLRLLALARIGSLSGQGAKKSETSHPLALFSRSPNNSIIVNLKGQTA